MFGKRIRQMPALGMALMPENTRFALLRHMVRKPLAHRYYGAVMVASWGQ